MRKNYLITFLSLGAAIALLINGCGFSDYKDAAGSPGTSGTGTTTTGNPPVAVNPPTPDPSSSSGGTATFTQVNTQIFQAKCIGCHGSGGTPDLSSYSSFATNTKFIVPGNPSSSLIYEEVQSGAMPQGTASLTSAELGLMSEWITEGALNN
jgi:mono/diheme cytochrome c family protein